MKEKCHFIGIGGIGMSGLAKILIERNVEVSGSDLAENYVTEKLSRDGAKIFLGHSGDVVTPGSTVVFSTDIKEENPEFQMALQLKCRMFHRSELLLKLMEGSRTLAVTGTHGKTTTSALLASVLKEGGVDPSFAIGGTLPQYGTNASHGSGEYFVAEADESDGSFLNYTPYGAIVTNINLDHMVHYKTEENLMGCFQTFLNRVESANHLFWCGDDARLQSLSPKGVSYGFGEQCLLRATNIRQNGWHSQFDITFNGQTFTDVSVALPGQHNVLNALAVFGLALTLGVDAKSIRNALASFGGVLRRCEKKGEQQNVLFIDDYAHHPVEIAATLKGIRKAVNERRVIAIFQPHKYSRTQDCMEEYRRIFDKVDHLIVTDIYASREPPIQGVTPETVRKKIETPSTYVPREQLATYCANFVRPHDVVVTLGAGDVTRVSGEILKLLEKQTVKKYKVGVLFGGRSSESKISEMSSRFVIDSLDRELYEVKSFKIEKSGDWLTPSTLEKLRECDLFFPVMHGKYGEDGTLQGFFEMLDKPYVGPDFRSCAICMDKAISKAVWQAHDLRTSTFVHYSQYDWEINPEKAIQNVTQKLKFPVYVKGPHLGSSIGTYRVKRIEDLPNAIDQVFEYDQSVIIENEVIGRELEFAVFGNDEITVLPPGEVFSDGKFYDFNSKYSNDGVHSDVCAKLTPELLEKGVEFAKQAYQLAGCTVYARVDTFLDEEGNFWIGEVNPLPGKTEFSLFPLMCVYHGITGKDLTDKLIILALARKRADGKK